MPYMLLAKPKDGSSGWAPAIRSLFPSHETNQEASTFKTYKKAELFKEFYENGFSQWEYAIISQCTPIQVSKGMAFAPTIVDRDSIGNRFPIPSSRRL
jgi:hypothetical protein